MATQKEHCLNGENRQDAAAVRDSLLGDCHSECDIVPAMKQNAICLSVRPQTVLDQHLGMATDGATLTLQDGRRLCHSNNSGWPQTVLY